MNKLNRLLILSPLLLSACATHKTQPTNPAPEIPAAQTEDRAPSTVIAAVPQVEAVTPPSLKPSEAPTARPAPTPAAPSPALLALMQEADAEAASGNLDNAASNLERAIRLQPRNAELWQRLAEVRLKQHQPGLAEDLAKKSNVLARSDVALTKKNWAIIAEARRKKGDAAGAAEADAKANR